MNDDDFVDLKDTGSQLNEWPSPALDENKDANPLNLETVDDPWAQVQQENHNTRPPSSSPDAADDFASKSRSVAQNLENIHPVPSSKFAHSLPYHLTKEALQNQTEVFLTLLEPFSANFAGESMDPTISLEALHIDSTRAIWNKLTTIDTKRVIFDRSNIKNEMVNILRAWHSKAKNQPSWTRPMSIQVKKNRESIGPAIFGWGRTDVPAWVDTPRTPRSARFSPTVPDTPAENVLQIVEDDAVDFGDFESAPPSAIMASFDSPPTEESVAPPSASRDNTAVRRLGELGQPDPVQGLGILDYEELPISRDVRRLSRIDPQPVEARAVPTTTNQVPLAPQVSEAVANKSTPCHDASVADPWDLSVFEKQLLASQPTPTPATEETGTIASKEPVEGRTELTRSKKTPKEMADEATVERIVSLLPNLDFLLS
ncbi:protein of unknown function [Taphrina deformans PYCC 5710]|uniref:Uncharacterized protein n=1 Tax=Taphrina deformans (strain PYCC 5710 / ATCC 11124 / CBS 356.35 / IMI 108563 / JCM 9778 / NBRC 8474) TaxID=1097556 RepID=R4XEG7_TAPDE|nr:protein of unknown function [Taphrina deformans PYCC 5710]|eukprot:CCG84156.1 protein of unknown function [Taphrina deformans PYCC 5710]